MASLVLAILGTTYCTLPTVYWFDLNLGYFSSLYGSFSAMLQQTKTISHLILELFQVQQSLSAPLACCGL